MLSTLVRTTGSVTMVLPKKLFWSAMLVTSIPFTAPLTITNAILLFLPSLLRIRVTEAATPCANGWLASPPPPPQSGIPTLWVGGVCGTCVVSAAPAIVFVYPFVVWCLDCARRPGDGGLSISTMKNSFWHFFSSTSTPFIFLWLRHPQTFPTTFLHNCLLFLLWRRREILRRRTSWPLQRWLASRLCCCFTLSNAFFSVFPGWNWTPDTGQWWHHNGRSDYFFSCYCCYYCD